MKFIHLSDLHIGKRVNEFSMLEDQRYILKEITGIAERERAEAVLIAGDVYDKPIPSAEAVQLFDWFLTALAALDIPVFIVSGNHDSPERLSFGGSLLKSRNVYVSPVFNGVPEPVVLKDAYGELYVWLLPFIRPVYVRAAFDGADSATYDEAVREVIGRMKLDTSKRNVIAAHQFVTGASRCGSEEISTGGIDQVDASVFREFDYVALGHLHGPQHVGREEIRYCGTPLKYSFSESGHKKSVTVVELHEKGNTGIRVIPLVPRRDMREIRGTYEEVTARSSYEETDRMDYVHITLTDEEDIPDALNKLRVIYPNIMKMDYDNTRTRSRQELTEIEHVRRKTPLQLFGELYVQQNNQELSEEQQTFLENLIEGIREGEAK